jgi:hypothetical protein
MNEDKKRTPDRDDAELAREIRRATSIRWPRRLADWVVATC